MSDKDEYPRFATLYESRAYQARLAALEAEDEFIDNLTRAERERERERDAEMVDDLTRLEGECDDAITLAADLDGLLDLGEAHALMVKAKALVTDARQRMERFQCPPPQSTPPLQYDFWRVI